MISHLTVRRQKRHGTTLIEMVSAMALLLVLGVSAARMLGGVNEIGKRTITARQGRSEIVRFAGVIRSDIQLIKTVSDEDWPLEMQLPDRDVQYRYDSTEHRIDRLEFERNRNSGDKATALETFILPSSCHPQLSIQENLVQVVLRRDETRTWVIEALRP